MILRYIQEYIRVAESLGTPPFLCPFDEEKSVIVLNVDIENNPFLFCLTCETKIKIGTNTYKKMIDELKLLYPYHDFEKEESL